MFNTLPILSFPCPIKHNARYWMQDPVGNTHSLYSIITLPPRMKVRVTNQTHPPTPGSLQSNPVRFSIVFAAGNYNSEWI